MSTSWQVLPDGQYKRISAEEELLADSKILYEDVQRAFADLRVVRCEALQLAQESRCLIDQSRRERRLRTTTLHIVRSVE
jgi:hypothetical protein